MLLVSHLPSLLGWRPSLIGSFCYKVGGYACFPNGPNTSCQELLRLESLARVLATGSWYVLIRKRVAASSSFFHFSSFLFLVVMPGAPSSVLAPSSDALVPSSFLFLVVMPGAPSSFLFTTIALAVVCCLGVMGSGFSSIVEHRTFDRSRCAQLVCQFGVVTQRPDRTRRKAKGERLQTDPQSLVRGVRSLLVVRPGATSSFLAPRQAAERQEWQVNTP